MLTPIERWMFDRQLEYAKVYGFDWVVSNLRLQGYNRVADAIQKHAPKESK